MSTSIIGFAGIECYDLMLYLGRTLNELGLQVLMSDSSSNRALQHCVPVVEEWETTPIHYNGLDFVIDLIEPPEGYDIILIDFGKSQQQFSSNCNEIFMVTDYQKHNIQWVADCSLPEDIPVTVILRDRISTKITPSAVAVSVGLPEDCIIHVEDSAEDLEAKVLCQYNSRFAFHKVSKDIKDFIVKFTEGGWTTREVLKAMKSAARGK